MDEAWQRGRFKSQPSIAERLYTDKEGIKLYSEHRTLQMTQIEAELQEQKVLNDRE